MKLKNKEKKLKGTTEIFPLTMVKYLLIVLLFFIGTQASRSQLSILREDADSLVKKGTDYIYNIQFDSATACFHQVIQKYPDNPAGYFLDAMVDWWQITLYRETESIDNSFLQKIDKVLEVCDKRLQKNEYDITALFFKGGAVGYRGRFYAVREKWFKAISDGKEGFDILVRCWQFAPGNHDIMLGTGIYNYFAVELPEKYPALKVISAFLPSGDKKIGILQLESAAKYARYASVEAKVVLLQIYYQWEEDYPKAFNIAYELFTKYPNNPYFERYLGRCYVCLGMRDKWEATWRDAIEKCIQKKTGYDRVTAREALYYVGLALMMKGDYENSLKYFYKCDEACRYLDNNGPSGFMVRTNLYIGQIFDKQGKRKYAVMQYEKVKSWKDYKGSVAEADRYLQKPYGK